MAKDTFSKLQELSTTTSLFSSIQMLAEWDQETYMPKEAIHVRSVQVEMLAGLIHRNKISKTFAKTLDQLIDLETGAIKEETLSVLQIAAVQQWRRDYIKMVKLPSSFVKQFAKTTSTATHAWQSARRHNDFREFAPHLEKVVQLCRKKTDILGFQEHPYDALLDLYEPDMKTSYLVPLFAHLKLHLKKLLQEITASGPVPHDFLYAHCPAYKQMEFNHQILKKMGFHESTSRLDQSVHPFCTGLHPSDTRMTTRIHPENVFSNISAVLHEGGHGLYNMGLNTKYYGTPICEQVSLGIDESQSRWWETLIGHSRPFWEHFFPLLQKDFPEQFKDIPLEALFCALNIVRPSLIRIESDEVTYNLHIIVRFEIEKGLIEGTIRVRDIPSIWNEKMREYLGIAPQFDGEGCLQDIHWSLGSFGYFPTYTLGNLYAAQFFEVFETAHPHWKESVANGQLDFIREWLRENIHQHGRQYSPSELCTRITHKPLSEAPFLNYLKKKYTHLYGLK